MTSQVNPYNIDGSYPIAGQDNDSQGFRDNFTNTRNNFEFIKSEIEDLQNNAILKTPLANTTLNNEMLYAKVTHPQLNAYSESYYDIGGVSLNQSINYDLGNYQKLTTGGSIVLGFIHWPTAGQHGKIKLQVSVTSVNHTLTLPPACVSGFPNELAGIDGLVITFPQIGDYYYEFATADGGVTILTRELGRAANTVQGNLTVTGTTFVGPEVNASYVVNTVVDSGTVSVTANVKQVFLDSVDSTTVSSLTLYIPASAEDGRRLNIKTLCPITTVTVAGGTVKYAPADVFASGNVSLDLLYSTTSATWLRI